MSIHANTAKAIRKELKKEFPLTKFSVTSQIFAGGNSVHIEWTDGPTMDQVDKITNKYQEGHFNSMEDMYELSNLQNDIPQVKYVQTRREVSEDIKIKIFDNLQKTHKYFDEIKTMDECNENLKKHWNVWSAREFIYRLTVKQDLTQGWQPT